MNVTDVYNPAPQPPYLRTGDRVVDNTTTNSKGEEYILAQVNNTYVQAISLRDGNRWTTPVRVLDPRKLTEEELQSILSKDLSKWKVSQRFIP